MKIDATRYNLFWQSPEKYRLREIWKLAPKEPKAGTFASLLTYGRRRGTCFHEMLDGLYRQVDPATTVQELRDGGFGEKEIKAATAMVTAVNERYADEEVLAHEVLFESHIPDSPHSLVGRIDRIIRVDGAVFVKDYKTSKKRSKTDTGYRGGEYCRGAQVDFYLLGARALGFEPAGFIYSLVSSGDDRTGVSIAEFPTNRTSLQLKSFQRGIHQTCELIQFMKDQFGIEKPWPNLPTRFDSDYAAILGQNMYEDYMPEGFTPKREHLELMQEAK